MKIALVHDYLYTYGGGERVLEMFHDLFPDAPVYTLFYSPNSMPGVMKTWDIHVSGLQKVPYKKRGLKLFVPCMPVCFEAFDFSEYDLVISVCSAFSKGIITGVDTVHISYILTVPRFLWGYETSTQVKHKKNILMKGVNTWLRVWDRAAADRPDFLIANAVTVQKRIAKAYNRDSKVIYSPVDETIFTLSENKRSNTFLITSRLEPYKRIDLAVRVCTAHNIPLQIIGEGKERKRLEKLAGPSVTFSGHLSDAEVIKAYQNAKAVIFPGSDDMGLVPIEAQMCGAPVIAYGRDGATETIVDGLSGILFQEQTEGSLYAAMQELDKKTWNPKDIRKSVIKFTKKQFMIEMQKYVQHVFDASVK